MNTPIVYPEARTRPVSYRGQIGGTTISFGGPNLESVQSQARSWLLKEGKGVATIFKATESVVDVITYESMKNDKTRT